MQSLLTGVMSACTLLFLAAQPGQSSRDRGAAVYKQYCQLCHQPDGNGVPLANPSLAKTTCVTGEKAPLITWVLKGTVQPKRPIDGKTYLNNMAPLAVLTDQQIADVLTYVRSSFGNNAPAVTPAEVKAVRDATK